jgi:anti-sigma factor RsiW
MTSDQLESLLLDRALGELPPAVVALLEEHLARDAAAARRAAELAETMHLARVASPSPSLPATPRPLDVQRLRQLQALDSASRQRSEFYRLAASLAIGLGLGWFVRPPSPPPPLTVSPLASYAPAPEEPRSTFWSITRLAGNHRRGATFSDPTGVRPPLR